MMAAALVGAPWTTMPGAAANERRPAGTAQARPAAEAAPPVAPPKTPAWIERPLLLPLVGRAMAYVPHAPTPRVVLFISGDGGWNLGVVDMARRLATRATVIGISYPALRRGVGVGTRCWYPAADLERISHVAQKQLHFPEYRPPVLVGYSSGATLVYAALAAAPAVTFAGGVSLGFCPDLEVGRPVCAAGPWRPAWDPKTHVNWLPTVTSLPRPWYVLHGLQDQVCSLDKTRAFVAGIKEAHLIEVPGTGHGFGRPERWGEPFDTAIDDIWKATTRSGQPTGAPPVGSRDLQARLDRLDLPLEYRWAENASAFVVFFSGDGGWAALDEGVAETLVRQGIGVVGLSTLRYFWNEKTPADVAGALRAVVEVLAGTGRPVFAGGYSFGADVVPVALARVPAAGRPAVAGLALVAPGQSATFEIDPLDWVRQAPESDPQAGVAPAVRALDLPAVCVAGTEEDDSACAQLQGSSSEVVRLPGSHHFNGDYAAVGEAVTRFIKNRIAGNIQGHR